MFQACQCGSIQYVEVLEVRAAQSGVRILNGETYYEMADEMEFDMENIRRSKLRCQLCHREPNI